MLMYQKSHHFFLQQKKVLKKFGEESLRPFFVGFYFVRFICPFLAMPDDSLDIKLTPQRRLNLFL